MIITGPVKRMEKMEKGTSVAFRIALERYGHDPKAVVELALAHGWSVDEIVREVVKNSSRDDRRGVAEQLAPYLGITIARFMRIADART